MSLPRTIRAGTRPTGLIPRALGPRYGQMMGKRHKSGPYGYTQAKALVYSKYGNPADVLSLHTHSITPSLPPSTLLLRTLATPINPADINQIQGVYPARPPFTSLLGTPAPSAVGGNEGCFEILSSPAPSTNLSKGDWVIMRSTGFGTWRTHATASPDDVIKISNKEGLTPIQVGTVSVNPCTAYRMLRDFETLDPGAGDWFIQNGANSGVGRAAIQFGRLWGVKSLNVIRDGRTRLRRRR
ncbi:Enoyl-[acyl-carrier-protein] reductase, mitochondrial [Lachnellula subtilissima]|uniref:Enoyl-[acyl-carrier-protein] reductase, mitochondrial n=1 Tax=Lachnellula subtilissima TaxID=602034 RepID=A0A8H8RKJ8_9HELO|nr:Enoyl-[acyl-carrier-protein] reductase, mitochondrial [Lachnellula subtilissima]